MRAARNLLAVLVASTATAATLPELTGTWLVVDRVERTDYAAFRDLRVAYRVELRQEGVWLFGSGEKCAENGRPLRAAERTPISIAGTVSGGAATARWVETGRRRESEGTFAWRLVADDEARGGFTSTVAGAAGRSTLVRADDDPGGCARATRATQRARRPR